MPKIIIAECLLMGKHVQREESVTFRGKTREEIKKKADFYARYHDMEILFFQTGEASSTRGFWGGIYA